MVIANGPARWRDGSSPIDIPQVPDGSRAEAVFAGPYAAAPDRYRAATEDDGTGADEYEPSLWTFSFDERNH
ncbi:hypothetical protein [Gordonia alkanivorans]|uniref:hypothetical protein n=1 Tax=Gordonia alkanivorans TaxID=84096 RepID=UPI001F4E73F5|nr:hypothetical protein [Gordonia alkanivorans]